MNRIREAISGDQQKKDLSDVSDSDYERIRGAIAGAEAQAKVGTEVTPMAQIPVPFRALARLIGRLIVVMASFITVGQRSFNTYVVHALKLLTDALEWATHMQTGLRQQMDAVRHESAQTLERLSRQEKKIDDLVTQQAKAISDLAAAADAVASIRMGLVLLERRNNVLLEEVYKRLPERFDEAQLERIAAEAQHSLDAFYLALEERFRGRQEEVIERLRIYLPYVRHLNEQAPGAMVVDLGCGRGEWLDLLRSEGFPARGVDKNRVTIAQCRERGLDVVDEDAIAYLRGLPDAEVGIVTAFHLIEHLPFEILVRFLDETLRVLRPGGLVILETPNPRNILVASCNFYLDPTHVRPLPNESTKLLVECRGFVDVEVLELHPSTAVPVVEETDVARRFNGYFYGPMDYAVIGRKR